MNKNYYGFNHKQVNKRFEGGLTYLNDVCVNKEYAPVAVYKVDSPNRDKGHKDYLLLQTTTSNGKAQALVRGMDAEEMEKYRFQDAIKCTHCNDVIYSVNRHDNRYCECGKVSIDGGSCYTSTSFELPSDYVLGTIDILTDEFKLGV